jgi:cell division septum initiation protein DivIVA
LAADEAEFPIVMRGYDRDLIDDALRDLRRQLLQISTQNSQLVTELREANERASKAEHELAEIAAPSYASVGARAALILSTAETQALEIVAEAQQERERILNELEGETEELRAEAKTYYDSLVSEANRRAERTNATAKADYDEIVNQGRRESVRMIDEAIREAGATRGAIATEVAKMRATAKREIEAARTKFERELSERRLIAKNDINRELDFNRALELVTEQARIDLNLELTARRAEADAEYLAKHQEAVAATQKYLDEANAVLSQARLRADAASLEAETLEAAARSVNKRTTDEARAKAEAILLGAETEARSILAEARAKAVAEAKTMAKRIAKLKVERDAVAVYLKNLKAVVELAEKGLKG